uniref:A2 mating-type protein n=1 Tax=Phanerodontia chrysosporium TaxID=2822231 RepID=E7DAI7_PHACH|nr:A2 mating-type protein [Phanerodontia chrysosporium]
MTSLNPTMLSQISRSARLVLRALATGEPTTTTTTPLDLPPHQSLRHCLPEPQPIVSQLLARGFRLPICEDVSQRYMIRARMVQQSYEQLLCRALQAWITFGHESEKHPEANISAIVSRYRELYALSLQQLLQATLRSLEQFVTRKREEVAHRVTMHSLEGRERSLFNQEATPTLEHAFSTTPYPTRLEKERLARHTGMEYRQIHVWFQNRRNRSKKGGQPMKKQQIFHEVKEESFLTAVHLHSFSQSIGLSPPADDPLATSKSLHGANSLAHETPFPNPLAALASERAAHAYPAPYPPVCHYDPFPVHHTFTLPWPRAAPPNCGRESPSSDANINDLICAFRRMTLVTTDSAQNPETSNFAVCGFATRPAQAPLPALIQSSRIALSCPSHEVGPDCYPLQKPRTPPDATCGPVRGARTGCQESSSLRMTRNSCLIPHPWHPYASQRLSSNSRSPSVSSPSSTDCGLITGFDDFPDCRLSLLPSPVDVKSSGRSPPNHQL